jgi:D-tyrosyl-tRNA(Tyr) deacylase
MKGVIQRVGKARVEVEGKTVGAIEQGMLLLLGVEKGDQEGDANWLAHKVAALRIFNDEAGKMNLSLAEINGGILVVSQFTLAGNVAKGRRPSFDSAAPPTEANRLYELVVERLRQAGLTVATGIFQADMQVHLVNDGPVTFLLESPRPCDKNA